MALSQVTVRQRKIGSLGNIEEFSSESQVVETTRIFATPSICKGYDGKLEANVRSKIILDGNPVINLWVTETCAQIAALT